MHDADTYDNIYDLAFRKERNKGSGLYYRTDFNHASPKKPDP